MKKLNSITASIITTVVLCGLLHSVVAQTTDVSTQQWRKIHLQHIRPDMLAYWLDPTHQMPPLEYRKSLPSIFYRYMQGMPKEPEIPLAFPNLSKPNANPFTGVIAADDSQSNL